MLERATEHVRTTRLHENCISALTISFTFGLQTVHEPHVVSAQM